MLQRYYINSLRKTFTSVVFDVSVFTTQANMFVPVQV